MKKIITLISLFSLISCVSTKYSISENKSDFSQVNAGEKYVVFTLDNNQALMTVNSVDSDSIIGTQKNQRVAIAKKDVKYIDKNKTGATVILVAAGVAIIYSVYAILKVVKDTAEKLGQALPPL